MKTNLKTAVLGIALMASVTGAFASDIVKAFSNEKRVDYLWQKYQTDGTTEDGDPQPGTESENPFASDCPNTGSTTCAIGSPVTPGTGPTITVRYSF